MEHICRHGFYYIIALADWRRRRRGKALRNALFVIKQTSHGMQGRVLVFQEHPFECQSNYAAIATLRSNFDAQDLRRVLPEEHWLEDGEEMPHIGDRPEWGYMNVFEWDGEEYVPRRGDASEDMPRAGAAFRDDLSAEEWRGILLHCLQSSDDECAGPDLTELADELEREAVASFSDGLNTGFYINAYTTKQCPTMDGVLDELRAGLERLNARREAEQARVKDELAKLGDDAEKSLSSAQKKALKGRSRFGETLDVLKRLSASYRRCYWKSGSEMLFPIFFGHLTFASHRCWTIFIKKGVFLAAEAWRQEYGSAVRHAAIKEGGGEVLQYVRAGLDP